MTSEGVESSRAERGISLKPLVILNPAAGRGRGARRETDLVRALKESYPRFELSRTRGEGDAERMTAEALRQGAELILAAGGDGTLNEVVNGFFDGGRMVSANASLGIIPAGTGSDFARFLGRGRRDDMATWIRRLKRGRQMRSDVGFVSWKGGPSTLRQGSGQAPLRTGHRYFINIVDAGLGGEAMVRVKRGVPCVPKKFLYLVSGLMSLVNFRSQEAVVLFPSGEVVREKILMLVVANAQFFGAGMHVAPRAKIDDGLLDVYVIRERGILGVLGGISRIYRGQTARLPGVVYRQVPRLEVSSDVPLRLDIDGEPRGELPATFEVVKGAINLLVP